MASPETATAASGIGSALASPAASRARLGMYVFLASDLMLFAPFFAAYYLLRTGTGPWPPPDVTLDVGRAGLATAALVASSFTLLGADRAGARGDLAPMRRWLAATLALGGAFLANQALEYSTLSFRPDAGTYSSVFWLLTGLHSAHVAVGLAALLALATRTVRARHPADLVTWMGPVSAYWHLVDGIWVAVFVTIWIVR